MRIRVKNAVFFAGILFMFLSCKSTGFEGPAVFTGRVCGPEGNGVSSYMIQLGRKKLLTDTRGYFVFGNEKAGLKEITGSRKGWSSIKQTVNFTDRKAVYFFQVEKMSDVYASVEELLKAGLFNEAEQLLENEKKSNGTSELFDFYCNLTWFLRNRDKQTKEILIEKAGEK